MPFDDIIIIYSALTVLLAAGIATTAAFRIIPLSRIRKSAGNMQPEKNLQEGNSMMISVVAYSRDCGDRLRDYLKDLAKQDCEKFETIVVVDSDQPDIQAAVSRISEEFPDVHITFIPPVTYHLGRRKLAFMLGIKAAQGEIVVTTSSSCAIMSESWLREITSGFSDPGTGLILGLALPDPQDDRAAGRLYRQFDSVLSTSLSINAAMHGKPVRGDIFNMAFRRSLFFKINGFSPSNFLHSGENDIFVAGMSRETDTAVCTCKASRLLYSPSGDMKKYWTVEKARRDFTSRYIPRAPFIRSGAASCGLWIATAAAAGMAAIPVPCMAMRIVPAILMLAFWILLSAAYSSAASFLGCRNLRAASVPFCYAYPVANKIFRLRHRKLMRLTYTWRR